MVQGPASAGLSLASGTPCFGFRAFPSRKGGPAGVRTPFQHTPHLPWTGSALHGPASGLPSSRASLTALCDNEIQQESPRFAASCFRHFTSKAISQARNHRKVLSSRCSGSRGSEQRDNLRVLLAGLQVVLAPQGPCESGDRSPHSWASLV